MQLKPCLFREESITYKDGIQSKRNYYSHTWAIITLIDLLSVLLLEITLWKYYPIPSFSRYSACQQHLLRVCLTVWGTIERRDTKEIEGMNVTLKLLGSWRNKMLTYAIWTMSKLHIDEYKLITFNAILHERWGEVII